jgi:hypothetical protein
MKWPAKMFAIWAEGKEVIWLSISTVLDGDKEAEVGSGSVELSSS